MSGTPRTGTIRNAPVIEDEIDVALDGPWQVILFNDDHNLAGFVVHTLMRVFGHNEPLATKIMLEAHHRGRAVAEIEEKEKAQLHKDQLQSFGLTASIEKV